MYARHFDRPGLNQCGDCSRTVSVLELQGERGRVQCWTSGQVPGLLNPWLRPRWAAGGRFQAENPWQYWSCRGGIMATVLLWGGCAVACVQGTCTVLGGP